MIQNFAAVLEAVRDCQPSRVAVAAAHDDAVLEAVKAAKQTQIADFMLVGDQDKIKKIADSIDLSLQDIQVIHESDDIKSAYVAVQLVSSGKADLVMKGYINTADLLRAVLDKEIGLRTGRVLSHAAVIEVPAFDRLLIITDGGMNIAPNLMQKADIIQNSVELGKALGISPVRVAVLGAVEVLNPDMPATLEAAALAKMADRGQIRGAMVDGPLALDNALSVAAAEHKKIHSPVAGLADVLLVPNIEAGNILGKAALFLAKGKMAGLILGARKPVIVTSRSDSHEGKLLSIAMGSLLSKF